MNNLADRFSSLPVLLEIDTREWALPENCQSKVPLVLLHQSYGGMCKSGGHAVVE